MANSEPSKNKDINPTPGKPSEKDSKQTGPPVPASGDVLVTPEEISRIISGKQAAKKPPEPDKNKPKEAENPTVKKPEKESLAKVKKADKTASQPESPKPDKAISKPEPSKADKPAPKSPDKKIVNIKEKTKVKTESEEKKPANANNEKSTEKTAQEQPAQEQSASEQPETPPPPPEPKKAPRYGDKEEIVHISLSELHPFKDHPFQVKRDSEMSAMVESIKDKGVTQAAVVRPREGGGYEMISGHRRQLASELAGFTDMPCIIRNLTDEQAITQMVEDNTTQRESILPSERAKALKMQLDAIKRQGERNGNGQRSNEVVAERNKMTVKQVQRFIKLNELVPELLKMLDEQRIKFTPAVELAFISPNNQKYIAMTIESLEASPSLSQAQKMRELDQGKKLNHDVIDGIMSEQKKEEIRVIISGHELEKYFGKESTPQAMKDQIIKLLDDWSAKQKEMKNPQKQAER